MFLFQNHFIQILDRYLTLVFQVLSINGNLVPPLMNYEMTMLPHS